MADTELTKPISAQTIQEKIRDRIRAMFVELIPEEQWKALVDSEIRTFSEGPQGSYYERARPAPLAGIIRQELDAMFRQKIKDELAKPEFKHKDDGSLFSAGDFVCSFLKEHADIMIAAALGNIVQNMLDRMKSMIGQDLL